MASSSSFWASPSPLASLSPSLRRTHDAAIALSLATASPSHHLSLPAGLPSPAQAPMELAPTPARRRRSGFVQLRFDEGEGEGEGHAEGNAEGNASAGGDVGSAITPGRAASASSPHLRLGASPPSRLQLKHERTVAALRREEESGGDVHMQLEPLISALHTPLRTPRSTRHGRGSASLSLSYASPHALPCSPTASFRPMLPLTPASHLHAAIMDGSDRDSDSAHDVSAGSAHTSPPHPLARSTPSSAAYLSPERTLDSSTPFSTPRFSPSIGTPRVPPSSMHATQRSYTLASPALVSPAPSGMHAAARGARRFLNPDGTQPSNALLRSSTRSSSSRANLFATPTTASASGASSSTSPLLMGMTGSPTSIGSLALTPLHPSAHVLNHAAGGHAMAADTPESPVIRRKAHKRVKVESSASEEAAGLAHALWQINSLVVPSDIPYSDNRRSNYSNFGRTRRRKEPPVAETSSAPPPSSPDAQLTLAPLVAEATSATGAVVAPPAPSPPPPPPPPPAVAVAAAVPVPASVVPHKPCNCKKSKCLKLYCECFARQDFCVGCNCVGCFNTPEPETRMQREKAIQNTKDRDPQAFFRAQLQQQQMQHAAAEEKAAKQQQQQPMQAQAPSFANVPLANVPMHAHAVGNPSALQDQQAALLAAMQGHTSSSSAGLGTSLFSPTLPLSAAALSSLPLVGINKPFRKGCHCKKSECQKKYCECFQAGVSCNEMCKCIECKNGAMDGHRHLGGIGDDRGKRRRGHAHSKRHQPVPAGPVLFPPYLLPSASSLSLPSPFSFHGMSNEQVEDHLRALQQLLTFNMSPQENPFLLPYQRALESTLTAQEAAATAKAALEAVGGSSQLDASMASLLQLQTVSQLAQSPLVPPPVNPFVQFLLGATPAAPDSPSVPPASSSSAAAEQPVKLTSPTRSPSKRAMDSDTSQQQMSPHVRSPSSMQYASDSAAATTPPSSLTSKRSQRIITSTPKGAALRAAATPSTAVCSPATTATYTTSTSLKQPRTRLSSTLDKMPSERESAAAQRAAAKTHTNGVSESATSSPHASPSRTHRQKRARHAPQQFGELV